METIDPRLLEELEKTSPELVQQYRAKMASSGDAMASAQKSQDMGNYANVAGRLANDFHNSQKQDIVYKNRMQDLGKAPTVVEAKRPEYDDSVVNKVTAQGVDRAKGMRQKDEQDFSTEQKLTDLQHQRDAQAKSDDPNSAESQQAREMLKRVAPSSTTIQGFDNMSAAQVQKVAPQLFNAYNAEANRNSQAAYRREMSAQTAANKAAIEERRQNEATTKRDEKMEQLRVGDLGNAQTPDDAKHLKDAVETKKSFDSKLDELISLRKDKGVEYLDREAVARGKQLSKELLLDYKNLAKLGVLSQSDEAIINAIIPSDPLGQDWMPGQDSTLHQLEKWKQDINRDYGTKLENRLRKENRNIPSQSESTPPPHGDTVSQGGKTYKWNGSKYEEVK